MEAEEKSQAGKSKPNDDSRVPDRLCENERLLERAQQALHSITRSIDKTQLAMGSGASVHDASSSAGHSGFDARKDALLQRVVYDLIGISAHDLGAIPKALPTAQQKEAPRRPGRYRQLV